MVGLGLAVAWSLLGAGAADSIAPGEVLALRVPGVGGRSLAIDPVGSAIVAGTFGVPKAGDPVTLADGSTRAWEPLKAGADGAFSPRGGYAFAAIESDSDRVMILEASGHGGVLVGDEPRAGDPYGWGFVRLPVLLKKGRTPLLFSPGRGPLRFKLVAPRAPAFLDAADSTLPDLVAGEGGTKLGAVVVVNASTSPLEGASLVADAGEGRSTTPLPSIPALGVRKVGFTFQGPDEWPAGSPVELKLTLKPREGEGGGASVPLAVARRDQARKVTFRSGIDGSIQYYGLLLATGGPVGPTPGLILSLHGAGVEGIGQARVYSAKSWAHVVAPTNRRPFGFDWEDWGRLDAMEVLDLAQQGLDTIPRRTYLTGHSMGGHGTWHLGVTYPDRFAAIAPSAGWISFASYANRNQPAPPADPVADLARRGAAAGDTLALASNLARLGVYVLHGDADDNVPVEQARRMRRALGEFHPDFTYHEQPGAGHWWGNECCDWPPLVAFLAARSIPEAKDVRRVDFVTAHPAVSSRSHWASVEAQARPGLPSALHLERDLEGRKVSGRAENVALLAVDLGPMKPGGPVAITLDGQAVADTPDAKAASKVWLAREGGPWRRVDGPPSGSKTPRRSGPFKEAFRNRMVFVHGTSGTPEENAWALARARFDAESFWYRGNGSVDVLPDSAFDPAAEPDRNVILYGHADANSAWKPLLGAGPVQVRRGRVEVGGRVVEGEGLACLFVRPRPGSEVASVGVVAGSGMVGARLTQRIPYLVSGSPQPDFLLVGPEALAKGAGGIAGAGYFGNDWGVESGEFAWR